MHKTQREYMHQKKKKILAFDTNGCVTKIQSVTEFENHTQNATSIHVQKKMHAMIRIDLQLKIVRLPKVKTKNPKNV